MYNALIFLIETFSGLYMLLLLLRFWLPLLRANFRNSLAQGIFRYTSPLVVPIRRIVPSIGRIDTATVIAAFALQYLVQVVTTILYRLDSGLSALGAFSDSSSFLILAMAVLVKLAMLSATLFIVAIGLRVILSWFGRDLGPISDMLRDLTEPMLRPLRHVIPPMGTLDLSFYIGIVLLIALNMVLADLMPPVP